MNTKKVLLTCFIATGILSLNAQSLQEAINKEETEHFEEAAVILKALTAKEPNNGENWFYYGENYFKRAALDDFKTADVDSAMKMYQKGFEVNSTNPLPYIGLGKIYLLQGNEKEGNASLYKAATLIDPKKPNPVHQLRLAEGYIAVPKFKNPDESIKILNSLMKAEGKNPEVHIVMGDALFAKNTGDAGQAIKSYDKAFELDKKSCRAKLKAGKIYKLARNEKLALQYFQETLKIDSTFAPAYREMAELYHEFGKDARALENIQKYVKYNNSDGAKKRLVEFMFVMKMYKEVIPIILELQSKGMNNPYLFRYLGWAYYEAGEKTEKDAYKKGLESIEQFFEKEGPDFKYLPQDYKYKGLLISKAFKDSIPMLEKAVAELKKAIEIDKEKNCELWSDIGTIYKKMKKYPESVEAFKQKAGCVGGLNGQDYYFMGLSYYYAKDFVNADTSFGGLVKLVPTNAIGYVWHARSATQLDPKNEKWLAKSWYETYFNMVKPEERTNGANKDFIVEASDYLISNCLATKDNEKAKTYFEVVNTVNPNYSKIPTWKKILFPK